MKKFLALILALVMALSLVACGGNNNETPDDNNGGDEAAKVKVGFITLLEKAKDGIEGKTGTRVHQ